MLTTTLTRVAVLCSGRASGLTHLLCDAPGRGTRWDIACVISSEEAFEQEGAALSAGVPVEHHVRRAFYAQHAPSARLGDRVARADYDAATVKLLRRYAPDLVLLAGYLLLLTEPMLAAYPRRILNVHHADLAQRSATGGPRYPGLRAVRDAIVAGERETRSSVHLVTAALDDGPVLLRSRPYAVPEIAAWAIQRGEHDVLRRVVWAHQEWMLREAFGPLMEQAIERLARQEQVA